MTETTKALVSDKRYFGKYVAFVGKKIVSSGSNPSKVILKAKELGYKKPIIMYISKEGVDCIY